MSILVVCGAMIALSAAGSFCHYRMKLWERRGRHVRRILATPPGMPPEIEQYRDQILDGLRHIEHECESLRLAYRRVLWAAVAAYVACAVRLLTW